MNINIPTIKNEDLRGIYNLLMEEIEPDLTFEMLPFLEEIYLDETEDERKRRMEWYVDALAIFVVRYGDFIKRYKEYFEELKSLVLQRAQQDEVSSEAQTITNIEDSLRHSE